MAKFDGSMNSSLLSEVGVYLYGSHWKTPLAISLGVSVRTIHYWVNEEVCMGSQVFGDLKHLVVDNVGEGHELINKLNNLTEV